ncbi:hypothetical protein AAC387_Pa02g1185 [Persea americana]
MVDPTANRRMKQILCLFEVSDVGSLPLVFIESSHREGDSLLICCRMILMMYGLGNTTRMQGVDTLPARSLIQRNLLKILMLRSSLFHQ